MQFAWIRKILPEARTIGVLYSPQENRAKIEAAGRVAQKMGLTLESQEISAPQDIPAALERLSQKADVLWGVADTVVLSPPLAKPILLFSFRNSIPFIGPSATWVKAGALWSLDYDYHELGAQCAELAEKILNGKVPGELAPEHPRSVNYSLNLNTARMMKITIPDDVLRGALHTY
jgi:putative ABC transport system substrate-binding protein